MSRDALVERMSVWGWLVVGIGLLLVAGGVTYGLAFEVVVDAPSAGREYLLALLEVGMLVLLAGFTFGVVGGGLWLGRSSFDDACQRRVAMWTGAGFLGSLLVILVLLGNQVLASGGTETRFLAQDTVVAVSGGAFAGLLLGVYDANLRRQSAEVRAQRNALTMANELLRHHVLNGMQVILGYIDIAREESSADDDPLDAVAERGEAVVGLVQRMGYLMRSLAEETDLYPVAVASVVEAEVAEFRERHPDAEVSLDLDESVRVPGDDLLNEVVANLLDNAAVHSDRETPEVAVTVTRERDRAEIHVVDEGPGIPDERKRTVFEPDESTADVGRGLGLYLVDRIVERYGGSVHVEDNDPRGAVFVVRLPLAAE